MTPDITSPLNAAVIPIVLTDQRFASRGYLWGLSGGIWYCFINPNKLSFNIWKKKISGWAWLVPLLAGLVAGVAAGPTAAIAAALSTLVIPTFLVRHYANTGEAQNAPVVTNGPQMELPGNMGAGTFKAIIVGLVVAPTLAGMLLGAFGGSLVIPGVGTVGFWAIGGLIGLLSGINLAALFMFLMGLGARPFGSVFGGGFSEVRAPAIASTYHLGRSGTGFAAHKIGPLNPPPGLVPASGGLAAIIVAGAPAFGAAAGTAAATVYASLMANPTKLVVWGLIPLSEVIDGFIIQSIESGPVVYDGEPPFGGLIIVAGSKVWGATETAALLAAGADSAVATDGSGSAMLGSKSDWVIGEPSLTDLESNRDWLQRYGFMAL